jgi:ATP-dependent helicase/nuclease subunit A
MSAVRPPRELVLASAGSGKTYRISSRLVGLLAYGAEPEEVLASTFTRKAAGQILDRVLSRMAAAVLDADAARELAASATLDPDRPLPAHSGWWADLLQHTARRLHRLNVGTLDAFFLRAASAFESELGLPPGWRVPEEHHARRLRSRALQRVLAADDRTGLAELIRVAGRGAVRRSVQDHLDRSMSTLLAIEEQRDPAAGDVWNVFGRYGKCGPVPIREDRERLAAELERIQLPRTASGVERPHWTHARATAIEALRAGDWKRLVGLQLCQRVATGDFVFDRVAIEGETLALLESVVAMARRALRPILAAEVRALGALTAAYRAEYRRLQREAGSFGFEDLTRLIGEGDPLGSRSDLYYRLDARTRHLLLDEFQDTSLAQWEALAPIVDEVLSDDGRAAVIVADPKQSIYGWRGAEPALVHAVGDRYGLVDEFLATSWRSSSIVLDFVNTVFGDIAGNGALAEDGEAVGVWAQDFKPHRAERDLPGFVRIEVGPEDSGSRRRLHFRAAAERVAELRRTCPGFSIGVLTRTNDAVARMFLELRELRVPVSQEGGGPITDSAACEAVLALVRLADHPRDDIARYHVANSPVGQLFGFADAADLSASSALARRFRTALVRDGYGRTLSDLVRRLLPRCDAREARRLARLGELAYRFDTAPGLRPADFVRFAETVRIEDRTSADVRVMTVHQAKGLEFDIVLLPQLDEQIVRGGPGGAVVPYRDRRAGRVTAIFPAVNKEFRCLFPELETAERQRRESIIRDGLSALYVAITRARYAVHLLLAPDPPSKPSSARTPARVVREALADGKLERAAPGAILYQTGDPEWYRRPGAVPESTPEASRAQPAPPADRPAPVAFAIAPETPARRLLRRRTPSQLHGPETVDLSDVLTLENSDALLRGSVVHALFERIRWIEDPLPDRTSLLDRARSAAPGGSPAWLDAILEEFGRMLELPQVRATLSRDRYSGDPRVACELPFLRRHDDHIVEGVIDRLVVSYREGEPIAAEILDFKTDRIGPDQIELSMTRYGRQLEAYVDAVAEMYGIDRDRCTATLVFLEPGIARSIDPEPGLTASVP